MTLLWLSNPQLAVIQAQANQANEGIKAAKSAWAPQVFAFGQYNFIKHYQTLVEPNWIAGVGVNLPHFGMPKTEEPRSGSAEATLEQAEAGKAEAGSQCRQNSH